jgi:hypothetical protein
MIRKIIVASILVMITLIFVLSIRENKVSASFYYWRSVYQLDSGEKCLLDTLHVNRLYVKYFDVAWNKAAMKAVPAAVIIFSDKPDTSREIIPVIFIVNEVLQQTPPDSIATLAGNMASLIKKINDVNGIRARELQFDCDWNLTTRSRYFALLEKMKRELPDSVLFSATIRLHQVKYYSSTGVPPVNRGMLMFYNMGKLTDPKTVNSIFDESTAEKYIDYVDNYPLPLDYALPVFSWGVHLRNNKVIGLVNNFSGTDAKKMQQLKRETEDNYRVITSFLHEGDYFNVGDLVRVEEITPRLAMKAAKMLSGKENNHTFTVSLFHLEPTVKGRYEISDLENIYHRFN